MATSEGNGSGSQTSQVLLVDSQTLPVLLRDDTDDDPHDISVDLLQRALQGTSGIDDGAEVSTAEEVNLATLSNSSDDVVAIYQGEEGGTHTVKITLADAQSLGLQFTNANFPVSLEPASIDDGLKMTNVNNSLIGSETDCSSQTLSVNDSNFVHMLACSNVSTEGRMIDEEGNIVHASDGLQVLPSVIDGGINQSITLIPHYGLDGTVSYAVKLKDEGENDLSADYQLLQAENTLKSGLDVVDELTETNLKQDVLRTPVAVKLPAPVNLTVPETISTTSTITVPVTSLESLSKQILLPISSAAMSIALDTPVISQTAVISSAGNVTSPSQTPNKYFGILQDGNTLAINGVSSSNCVSEATLSLSQEQTTVVSQLQAQQQAQGKVCNVGSNSVINLQTPSVLSSVLNVGKVASPVKAQPMPFGNKLSNLLTMSSRSVPITSTKVMPVSVSTPAIVTPAAIPAPAMAAVAPNSNPPTIGGAAATSSKTLNVPNRQLTSSSKPLGSSENPIQLVQHGQTFHSMQALSPAQLRQIATVLQQKHLNSNSAATKNVLFDEQTKTRIVYRVVYPEDVDLLQPSSSPERDGNSNASNRTTPNKMRGRRGRPKRGGRTKETQNDNTLGKLEKKSPSHPNIVSTKESKNSGDLEENSEESLSRVERKKIVGARTRSGRVSRPPKHIMKDYKRLHHLDYHEPHLDDSDGGYSDYEADKSEKPSDTDKELNKAVDNAMDYAVDVETIVPRPPVVKKRMSRFSCPTCNKIYLGLGRMEKHFVQFPEHGSIEKFKQTFSATAAITNVPEGTEKDSKSSTTKFNSLKSRKRGQWPNPSDRDQSENRKKKLLQAVQACEVSEVLEVVGPLLARYYSLWDLLLLRLLARDQNGFLNGQSQVKSEFAVVSCENDNGDSMKKDELLGNNSDKTQVQRAKCNRVEWLLMELSSLADTLRSIAGDLLQPLHIHESNSNFVEICEKAVSELLGVSCGTYAVNELPLSKRIEDLAAGQKGVSEEELTLLPEKRVRKNMEVDEIDTLGSAGSASPRCPEVLSTLSLIAKPTINSDPEKVMLAKLTEDMPFLNSSDDMICDGEDHDLSADSKRDQDCDSAANLRVVDDIVNERLKNLSENLSFSVQLQGDLGTPGISGGQSGIHLIPGFGDSESSISGGSSTVISGEVGNSDNPSVSSMGLINSYPISSLSSSVPGTISNPVSSALEPVSSQSMLGGFTIGLPSLSSFDAIGSQPIRNVPHSADTDSFLDSLGSFETPLAQTCSTSNATVSVMKSNAMLQLESIRPPPKFISSFTPAITEEKQSPSITTAQRLQRSYLDLDSSLDVGLDADLDFEAFSDEFSRSSQS